MNYEGIQVRIPLSNMPAVILLTMDAHIKFVCAPAFKTIIDQAEAPEGVSAIFYTEGFVIGETKFEWETKYPYKEIPEMLQWLIQQKFQFPDFGQGE